VNKFSLVSQAQMVKHVLRACLKVLLPKIIAFVSVVQAIVDSGVKISLFVQQVQMDSNAKMEELQLEPLIIADVLVLLDFLEITVKPK
jgi:hypothetical protein